MQRIWGQTDPNDPDRQVAQPIAIQPVFNYSLKNGYYSSDWPGSVLGTAFKVNLSYAFPM